jgi:glycosyltransferase involved in cell wall biosynthesis
MNNKKLEMIGQLPQPAPGQTGWPWTETGEGAATAVSLDSECPTITIVTPSYNQGQFIEATIRSVLLQGYSNLEYFIMDGGSQDGTVDIIRQYEPWLTQWVSEPDRGQTHAINKGLDQGTGQIFAWLNSDDILLPNVLHQVALLYRQRPDAVGWAGGCYLISPEGHLLTIEMPRGLTQAELADWYHTGYIFQPSCFFAADTYRKIGSLDESLHYAMDFDLWMRLAAEGDFVATDEILAAAVIHKEAKTQALRADMHAETIALQIKYGYAELAARHVTRLMTPPPLSQQIKIAIRRQLSPIKQKLPFLNKRRQPIFALVSPPVASQEAS